LKIALIGSDGQLGTDVFNYFRSKGEDIKGLTIDDLDICDKCSCLSVLSSLKPGLVINTAAFNLVDHCEEDVQKAFDVNATGIKNVAEACLSTGAAMMHFSTDYVFSGYMRNSPYNEEDCPNPVSIYGISKLAGEYIVKYLLNKYYIIRISGLYGHTGSLGKGYNFVELMIKLAEKESSIKVVNDQLLTPTSSYDVAVKLYELIKTCKYGLYHMTNCGQCTWYEFAGEIFKLAGIKPDITPINSDTFGAKARRPFYSVLDNKNLRQTGLADLRHWKSALAQYMEERKTGKREK